MPMRGVDADSVRALFIAGMCVLQCTVCF